MIKKPKPKPYYLGFLWFFILTGCHYLKVEAPGGVKMTRIVILNDTEIGGLEAQLPDGSKIHIDKAGATVRDEILAGIVEVLKKAP